MENKFNQEAFNQFVDNYYNKEFATNFTINGKEMTICRADYENMIEPLMAYEFEDDKMQELANLIGNTLKKHYSFLDDNSTYDNDDKEETFWDEMEKCAISLGMKYYDEEDNQEDLDCDREIFLILQHAASKQ